MAKENNVAMPAVKTGGKYLPVCLWISTIALLAATAFQLVAMKALYVWPF